MGKAIAPRTAPRTFKHIMKIAEVCTEQLGDEEWVVDAG